LTRVETGGNKWGMEDITPAGTGAVQNQPGQTLGELYARVDDLASRLGQLETPGELVTDGLARAGELIGLLETRVEQLEARLGRVIAGTCPQFAEPDPAAEPPAE
jgi:hypothetical protein